MKTHIFFLCTLSLTSCLKQSESDLETSTSAAKQKDPNVFNSKKLVQGCWSDGLNDKSRAVIADKLKEQFNTNGLVEIQIGPTCDSFVPYDFEFKTDVTNEALGCKLGVNFNVDVDAQPKKLSLCLKNIYKDFPKALDQAAKAGPVNIVNDFDKANIDFRLADAALMGFGKILGFPFENQRPDFARSDSDCKSKMQEDYPEWTAHLAKLGVPNNITKDAYDKESFMSFCRLLNAQTYDIRAVKLSDQDRVKLSRMFAGNKSPQNSLPGNIK